jgi:predicted ATPase with chaperone activity
MVQKVQKAERSGRGGKDKMLKESEASGAAVEPHDGQQVLEWGDLFAPEVPKTIRESGVSADVLLDLLLKMAHTAATFTTDGAVKRLCLATPIVNDLLDQLKRDRLIEALGEAGRFSYRYAITTHGRERAERLMEICGYVGPAPVSLQNYTKFLEWQLARLPHATPQGVAKAISDLVLPSETIEVAGLAGSSGRSLFVYGPPGNGKTSLGHMLHKALGGLIWVPHCIGVDTDIVRMFDPQTHEGMPIDVPKELAGRIDRRWMCSRRPFVVAAGEMTLESLDLAYSTGHRYYEAPVHMKANGGTFLLDDFGRQRVPPEKLLQRWIYPLEHQADYLTLQTGQKIRVPFRQMLIVSTNLEVNKVVDSAFLRRIGYRLRLDNPSEDDYAEIFRRYAADSKVTVPEGTIERLLKQYHAEERPIRACEPRDLIERARDICTFRNKELDLSKEILDLAWTGYFGERLDLDTPSAD